MAEAAELNEGVYLFNVWALGGGTKLKVGKVEAAKDGGQRVTWFNASQGVWNKAGKSESASWLAACKLVTLPKAQAAVERGIAAFLAEWKSCR